MDKGSCCCTLVVKVSQSLCNSNCNIEPRIPVECLHELCTWRWMQQLLQASIWHVLKNQSFDLGAWTVPNNPHKAIVPNAGKCFKLGIRFNSNIHCCRRNIHHCSSISRSSFTDIRTLLLHRRTRKNCEPFHSNINIIVDTSVNGAGESSSNDVCFTKPSSCKQDLFSCQSKLKLIWNTSWKLATAFRRSPTLPSTVAPAAADHKQEQQKQPKTSHNGS